MNKKNNLKSKSLALYFTGGVSLKIWADVGMIDREIGIYNCLSPYFKNIYFFSYGTKSDYRFADKLARNIILIARPKYCPKRLYSVFLPFIHRKILKQIDFYKTNQMIGSWTAVISKIIFRKKLIIRTGYTLSINNTKEKKFNKILVYLIEWFAYSFADSIVSTSCKSIHYLRNRYRVTNSSSLFIPNYVDVDLFSPNFTVKKIQKSICFVGRLSREKNLFSLLKSLIGLPYQLSIVGSGELRNELERSNKELCLKIKFLGNVPNSQLPDILNKHEMFILPSYYEGLPKTLLEAMACGLPVIGSKVDGITDVIKDGWNGLLCRPTVDSIRSRIIYLMGNTQLKNDLGKNARKTIEDHYSLDRVLEKEVGLYERLLYSNNSPQRHKERKGNRNR